MDLASWHGTSDTPDLDRIGAVIGGYVAAGGHRDAVALRGGLPAHQWALGWHRAWIVAWFSWSLFRWATDPASEPRYLRAVQRHAAEAT